MPLEPYKRGKKWWARGRVEYEGRPLTDYYRCSIKTSDESGAWRWCKDEEQRQIRRHLIGDEKSITFAEAVLLYRPGPADAGYLLPIVAEIGDMLVREISPKSIRELAPKLYPSSSTDTWIRQVITPIRSTINNAHDLGQCPPIKIRGYSEKERVAQDLARGKASRVKKQPGTWEWLLAFRSHADHRHAALATFMFLTGARISQAIAMHPHRHFDLPSGRALIPAAKGHPDRWVDLSPQLAAELSTLPLLYPRGAERKPENLRLFGFADRSSPRKGWSKACKAAGIENLSFHAAGRHGFGQEMNVRQRVDEKAAAQFGGWSDISLMKKTYTHAEDSSAKIHRAQSRGLRMAEKKTKLRLARD